ncbi:MAG: hypothetical protein KJO34_15115 [Deltaproteobacteria bacterium]|nr:hypothetical protein [Deltaproteobacteria bacterium]
MAFDKLNMTAAVDCSYVLPVSLLCCDKFYVRFYGIKYGLNTSWRRCRITSVNLVEIFTENHFHGSFPSSNLLDYNSTFGFHHR